MAYAQTGRRVAGRPARKVTPSRQAAIILGRVARYAVVTVGGVIFLIPFLWMLSTSLKPQSQVFTWPPQWIPNPVQFQNYADAWNQFPTPRFFANTITVTVLSTIGQLITNSLVAFGFARLRFRGRNLLFLLVLSTMMLPEQVTLIPLFAIFSRMGWLNTYRPLIVPRWLGNPFYIFLLRQFYMSIPLELDDATRIDGGSYLTIYRSIVMPMAKPVLGVVAMFCITNYWTEFMSPLIYLNTPDKFTIAVGLRLFQSSLGVSRVHWMMAISLISILPLLVLFFVGQRYFVQGIMIQGMK
ncbi:MAG: carbohydrate ABC transporter permease [Anaerolineae bacterium]|jgi:multiple sugar transport system permease protein